ncbi:MAG: indolepyruvate ferredoxin oxidoreductase family protein [Betaproteobacteria bacterium]|nr:indolepyruvate ferredoxin oxidoreductase family protein [Betaproteobacteria bacterium]
MNAPVSAKSLASVSLDDKYTLERGRVYLTGTQALIRLPMLQRERDQAAGLNTACYISGYRGSPLGGYDQSLNRAKAHLEKHHIKFQSGVNEDLAATAIWGTQQVNLFEGAKYDGVFGIWYGKGPGVDRCGDVFRHGNAAGTSKHGGVLCLAGDDHGAKSSTQAAQSDFIFKAVGIPVLSPSNVQEYIDFGLHGFAMSRYSGCWVGFKCVTDVVEGSAVVEIDPDRVKIVIPTDFSIPPAGLSIRWPEFLGFVEQEQRLYHQKLFAVMAYARANGLDQAVWPTPNARLGIVTTGKAYNDVRQALDDLGIDEAEASKIGIRLFKVGMPWPLEPARIAEFCKGLEEVVVIEEKRQLVEYQLKEQLYNLPDRARPRIVGKFDSHGEWDVPQSNMLLPTTGEFTAVMVARVIAERIARFHTSDRIKARMAFMEAKEAALKKQGQVIPISRIPYFCSGCPHNSSTRVPEGSRALAGIGCHYMAQWMPDRNTATFSHMGGEGAAWCGQFPFSETKHVFANLGDGTYFHSGLLAIRFAVAAKAPITYKILFNDAVAMTGGQAHDGPLTPAMISRQVAAEGVNKIVVVTDYPDNYNAITDLAPGTPVFHRDELDRVQRELRDYPGVSVLIYDQTCAAEKRRRRKRGTFPDPSQRIFINEAVCEGCGDCGEASNCVSVEPLETEFGRKRTINQSSCNKDFSCVKGFCPSFVTVEGGRPRRGKAQAGTGDDFAALVDPALPAIAEPYGILVTGIGGTGVVTIGQLLGVAAHLEGKGVTVLDMAGLAQKNGAVLSHIRIANSPDQLHGARIGAGRADTMVGCDIVVACSPEALSKITSGRTRIVANSANVPTAEFTHKPDFHFPLDRMQSSLAEAAGADRAWFVDATRLATALMGDSIATNLFMLGYAYQKGMIPISAGAIERAIELNAVAVEQNKKAFIWGRHAAIDTPRVERSATPATVVPISFAPSRTLDESISRRIQFLTAYQDARYADQYRTLVEQVRAAEAAKAAGTTKLTEAVARYYFKLMAYKDEYEVARLYSTGEFKQKLDAAFEGDIKLKFHLAPPIFNKPDSVTGIAKKSVYGPWMLSAFGLLAKLKFLRGTALDVFGRSEERRTERALIHRYATNIAEVLGRLDRDNHAMAVQIAAIPEMIRGFGHVKLRHLMAANKKEAELLASFRSPASTTARAA